MSLSFGGIILGVCNWWICSRFSDCREQFRAAKYPPCACCVHFDLCDVCARRSECVELCVRYLPDLFRRMVHDIRLGVDTDYTAQVIRQRTLNGKRRD